MKPLSQVIYEAKNKDILDTHRYAKFVMLSKLSYENLFSEFKERLVTTGMRFKPSEFIGMQIVIVDKVDFDGSYFELGYEL